MELGTLGLALSVLAGLGAAGTWLTVGGMRGRMKNLGDSNDELRKEIEDEKRRHNATREALNIERKARQELQTRVEALADLPMAAILAALQGISDQLSGHHTEALTKLAQLADGQQQLLALAGDRRAETRAND